MSQSVGIGSLQPGQPLSGPFTQGSRDHQPASYASFLLDRPLADLYRAFLPLRYGDVCAGAIVSGGRSLPEAFRGQTQMLTDL